MSEQIEYSLYTVIEYLKKKKYIYSLFNKDKIYLFFFKLERKYNNAHKYNQ